MVSVVVPAGCGAVGEGAGGSARHRGFVRPGEDAAALGRPRWDGRPGRVETWDATFTDPARGDGLWLHAETHAPTSGAAVARGWCAHFPSDGEPGYERFGPVGVAGPPDDSDRAWFDDVGGRRLRWHDAFGHAYGRGPPRQGAWLHADLGHGEVAEVISVAPGGAGLSWLPPSSFVRLRADGRDWPRDPLLAAPRWRSRLGLPAWSVSGRVGDRRLRVWVHQPPDRSVTLGGETLGGEPWTCSGTARADTDLVVERRAGGRWRSEAVWQLRGTAHAGVGLRP